MIKVVDRLEAVARRISPPEWDRDSVYGCTGTRLAFTRGSMIPSRAELVTELGEVSIPVSPDMANALMRGDAYRDDRITITIETPYRATKLDSVLAVERRDGAAAALQYAKALLGAQ